MVEVVPDLIDIGEVCSRAGLPASTLHYYERQGLIHSVGRSGLRRQYEPDTLDRLAVITLARRAGFPLKEIASLLGADGEAEGESLLRAAQAAVAERLDALRSMEISLANALENGGTGLTGHERLRADPGEKGSSEWGAAPDEDPGRPRRSVRPGEAERGLSDLSWLRRVRDRIDREYAEPLDVEALARGAHMSAGHLSRQFRLAYGESPYSYLMTRRIERAMALLQRGDMSVTEVCFAVGYSSLGTFSTRFAELVGVAPGAYRRQAVRTAPGLPSCLAKQVSRPVRNREAPA